MAAKAQYPEQDTVKGEDWRLHAVTAVSQDGPGFKRGDVVKAAKLFSLRHGRVLSAGAPNIDALLLDYSAKLDAETKPYLDQLRTASPGTTHLEDTEFFDVAEKRMASAVFAFSAVESFANEVIAMGYFRGWQYSESGAAGQVETLPLERVLERVRTDDKLNLALPDYLKVKTPKGGVHWQNFSRLKKIRNRIIHLKGRDRGNSQDGWLWEELFNPLGWDFGHQMHGLIGYYVSHVTELNLRWFYKFPW
jgi:hypothetical protein